MTTEEKLEKIKKLADAMYFAAQTLTVDASRMRKPVEDYHQFVTHELFDREEVDALDRAMAAAFTLAADEKGMLADNDGRRIKLTEEGRRELEAIKKTNGGWIRDQKHDEESQTVDFGQELYKHFGRVKDFTLCTVIAKWFYETGRKAAGEGQAVAACGAWHDSNMEQPEYGRTVAIWNQKIKDGEILTRCTNVYPNRIWAYIEDLLPAAAGGEPAGEELERASREYEETRNDTDAVSDNQVVRRAFKAGSAWQRQRDEHLIWEISSNNYAKGKEDGRTEMVKEAVEAEVTSRPNDFGEYMPRVIVPVSSSYNIGDKVKLVIIKEQ